jgi:hypothetical protein
MSKRAPRNPDRSLTPRPSAAARQPSSPTPPSADRGGAVPPGSSQHLLLGVGLVCGVCLVCFIGAIAWIGHSLLRTERATADGESANSKPVVVKNNPTASESVASRPVPRDPPPRLPRSDAKVPKPDETRFGFFKRSPETG